MAVYRLFNKVKKILAAKTHSKLTGKTCSTEVLLDELQVRPIELEIQDQTSRNVQTYQETSRLENSLSLLSATLESYHDAILVVDLENTWVLYNQRFIDLWQIPNEIIAAKDDLNALAYVIDQLEKPEDFLQKVHELYASPETSSFDRLRFKDGKMIERYSIPQRINGQVVGRVWSFRDVTELERAVQAIKREAEKNLAFLHNASDGIHIIDSEGCLIEVSNSFCTMLGYQRDELIGKHVTDWDKSLTDHEIKRVIKRRLTNQGHSQFQTRHTRKDGSIFDVEISSFLFDLDGQSVLYCSSRDISDRKRFEAELRVSQKENQFLADLIRTSTQPMGIGYPDGQMGLVNTAFEKLTGYSAEELQTSNWMDLLTPPEWREIERNKLIELESTGGFIRYEKEYIRKNGERVPVELMVNLKTDSDGKPEFYYAFVTDITERKRAERENSENEQRVLLATEATGVGIWEWNLINHTIRWDAQMFRIYGIAPTSDGIVEYATWSQYVLPEDLPLQESIMQDTIRGLGHNSRKFRIRRHDDGKCRHIQAVETVRLSDQGRVEWLVGTNLDVTEQTLAEIAQNESEERWRFALQAANLGAWELNFAENTIWHSLRYDQIFGYEKPPEWSYEIFLQHVLEEDRMLVDNYIQDSIAKHQVWSLECRIRRADGQIRWILIQSKYHDMKNGRFERAFGLVEDITERKMVEQMTKDAARRKDEFLAMLAHELRNPLASICNAVEVMKLAHADFSRVNWGIDIIERQVKHLIRLVDDLLDVSRIKQGLVVLKTESLEIRDFVLPAVETCQPLIESRNQVFSLTLPAEFFWVMGDRIRLAQILSNLLNNACKYTPEGGHIKLSVEAFEDSICIRVTDNGDGIDQNSLAHLFDLFYQVDHNLDRAQGGLGIGLSLVQSLVEKHGGVVQAFSAGRGQGSEFVVRLPRLAQPIKSTADAITQIAPRLNKNLRILLVDDNPDVAESLALLLEIDGHQVLIANDGQAALEIARVEKPNVILLDIGLPGMNGYSVAKALRETSEHKRTLLVAVTGYGQPDDLEKSRASGFDKHLVKPTDIEIVRQLLADYQASSFDVLSKR